jgi:hypothetical protein
MNAVQSMRAKAQANGKLQSTPQEEVTTANQNGQSAIEIEPTDPQEIYVPVYDPAYIWGPPAFGFYPPLLYPGIGIGFGFGPGIYIGGFFGGCCGWGAFGWGWSPGWFDHRLLVNNSFMHRYGFNDFHGGGFSGTGAWAHNPEHRLGVPYSNRGVANQYRGAGAANRGAMEQRGAPRLAAAGSEAPASNSARRRIIVPLEASRTAEPHACRATTASPVWGREDLEAAAAGSEAAVGVVLAAAEDDIDENPKHFATWLRGNPVRTSAENV